MLPLSYDELGSTLGPKLFAPLHLPLMLLLTTASTKWVPIDYTLSLQGSHVFNSLVGTVAGLQNERLTVECQTLTLHIENSANVSWNKLSVLQRWPHKITNKNKESQNESSNMLCESHLLYFSLFQRSSLAYIQHDDDVHFLNLLFKNLVLYHIYYYIL